MNAVDITPTITGNQMPELNCSAVWGGKRLRASEIFPGTALIQQTSTLWACRTLWMNSTLH